MKQTQMDGVDYLTTNLSTKLKTFRGLAAKTNNKILLNYQKKLGVDEVAESDWGNKWCWLPLIDQKGVWVQYNILLSFRAMINGGDDPEKK